MQLPPLRFLSTPSARRATAGPPAHHHLPKNFYPRPPRGGRPTAAAGKKSSSGFLSTPSARRATTLKQAADLAGLISIHALREEGDGLRPLQRLRRSDFYPRPPRGGRRHHRGQLQEPEHFYPRPPRGGRRNDIQAMQNAVLFLSTPSARRATQRLPVRLLRQTISIHALREEGDKGQP